MKRAILQLIDNNVKNVDKYIHNGSTWLIFTNDLNWVIEYDKNNTLWYNYRFFQTLFSYVSIDVVGYQEFITEWFESRILKITPYIEDTIQNGVKHTSSATLSRMSPIEDIIQNGVKETSFVNPYFNQNVEDTIQNGVKHTSVSFSPLLYLVEDTIQNGVKETKQCKRELINKVEDTIQNGVKETVWRQVENYPQFVGNVIDKGVKEVQPDYYNHKGRIEGIILKNKK